MIRIVSVIVLSEDLVCGLAYLIPFSRRRTWKALQGCPTLRRRIHIPAQRYSFRLLGIRVRVGGDVVGASRSLCSGSCRTYVH